MRRFSKIVNLEIGNSGHTISVHQPLLQYYSSILGRHDTNNGSKVENIDIQDAKPEILETVVAWLYTGRLLLPTSTHDALLDSDFPRQVLNLGHYPSKNSTPEHPPPTSEISEAKKSEESFAVKANGYEEATPSSTITQNIAQVYKDLLNLYIFATTYDIRLLRLEVMKKWQSLDVRSEPLCGHDIVKRAYRHLPEESPLLKLIGSVYATRWTIYTDLANRHLLKEALKKFPPEFGTEILLHTNNQCNSKGRPPSYQSSPCKFHEHANNEEKTACQKLRREEKVAPKRKQDADVEYPDLKRRVYEHKEYSEQLKVSGSKLHGAKVIRDHDSLITSITG
jgi:hypothetical protein